MIVARTDHITKHLSLQKKLVLGLPRKLSLFFFHFRLPMENMPE